MTIELKNITKVYKEKNKPGIFAIDNLSLKIKTGEKVIIIGESGAGKTTLLNIITLLDKDFTGESYLNGINTLQMNSKDICNFRNEEFGFIFQDYLLVEDDTVYANVEIPLLYSKKIKRLQRKRRINEILDILELKEISYKKAKNLSGGQRQRVAIARALVNMPNTLILDEPTGALNRELSNNIMNYVYEYINTTSKTMIMVTHDIDKVKIGKCRVLKLHAGKLIEDDTW